MPKQVSSTDHSINFSENGIPNSLVEWISDNKKVILGTFVSLLLLLILAFRLLSGRNANSEADFLKAQNLFNQFQQNEIADPEKAKEELQQLEVLMSKYPDLHAKYDGAIAQSFLIEGNSKEAISYAERVFKRTQPDQLSLYREFAQNSLLIGSGEYEKALEKTKQFNQLLEAGQERVANPTLYLYNLIRLAILYQQLGQSVEEGQTWALVQNQLSRTPIGAKLGAVLQSGKSSFKQYIDERMKIIESK